MRQWSIYTLKNFFSPVVCCQKDQRLIDCGPYSQIRHPSYLGLILELVGLALVLKNILATVVILVLIMPAIIYRIRVEEKVLLEKFGDVYIKYKAKTKGIFLF